MTDIKPEWIEKAARAVWLWLEPMPAWEDLSESSRTHQLRVTEIALKAVVDDIRAETLRPFQKLVAEVRAAPRGNLIHVDQLHTLVAQVGESK